MGRPALTPYPGADPKTDVFLDVRLALAGGAFLPVYLVAALVRRWIAREARSLLWTPCGVSALAALLYVSLHSWRPWAVVAGTRLGRCGGDLVRTPPQYLDLVRTSVLWYAELPILIVLLFGGAALRERYRDLSKTPRRPAPGRISAHPDHSDGRDPRRPRAPSPERFDPRRQTNAARPLDAAGRRSCRRGPAGRDCASSPDECDQGFAPQRWADCAASRSGAEPSPSRCVPSEPSPTELLPETRNQTALPAGAAKV